MAPKPPSVPIGHQDAAPDSLGALAQDRPVEPEITVGLSTMGRRALTLTHERLPQRPGLAYHIVVQSPDEEVRAHLGALARRPDVRVLELEGRGVARSRNLVLATAAGGIVVLADDDIELVVESYGPLARAFRDEPDLGCVLGVRLGAGGRPKRGPLRDGARLRPWNAARIATPQMALRLSDVRRLGLRFDERFGAGTDLPIGDEFIFLIDGLRAGLRARHRRLPFALHPHESSGVVFDGPSLEIRRKVFARALGRWSWMFRLAFAARNARRFASLREALRFLRP